MYEKYKVLGIQILDFKAKDGSHVSGYKIYYGCKDKHVQGFRTDSFFVPAIPDWVKVGVCFNPVYNRYGRMQDMIFADGDM